MRPIRNTQAIADILESGEYPEKWDDRIPLDDRVYVVLGVLDEDELVGCFPVMFHDNNEAEIHVAMRPDHRGQFAVNAAHDAFKWIFGNTETKTIFAKITRPNVARFAEKCGMEWNSRRYELKRG